MAAEYVNKEKFLEDIRAYQARKAKNPDEQIPEYSAMCIMKIAQKVSNRPNFIGYSYKADMISDGIYVCLKYFDKFNPEIGTNPFGYFTQCIWFAFLQRIAKEKKQQQIRGKIIAQTPFELFDLQDQDLDENFRHSYNEFLQEHNYVDEAITKKKSKLTEKESTMVSALSESEEDPGLADVPVDIDTDTIVEIADTDVFDEEDDR